MIVRRYCDQLMIKLMNIVMLTAILITRAITIKHVIPKSAGFSILSRL